MRAAYICALSVSPSLSLSRYLTQSLRCQFSYFPASFGVLRVLNPGDNWKFWQVETVPIFKVQISSIEIFPERNDEVHLFSLFYRAQAHKTTKKLL